MHSIPLPDDAAIDALPDRLRDAARSGALINVFRSMLRSPDIAAAVIELGAAQFATSALSPTDRELAILAAGACFASPYEAAQHEPISRAVGVSDEKRAATAEKQWTAECFCDAEQTLLRFVDAVASGPTVDPELFDAMHTHYSDQQIVETVVQTGYYFLIARASTVLDIPLDPPADDSILQAGLALQNATPTRP